MMTAAAEAEAQADRGCAVVIRGVGWIAVIVRTICIRTICVRAGIVAVRVRPIVAVAVISVRIGGAASQGYNRRGGGRPFHERSHRGLLLAAPKLLAATPVIAGHSRHRPVLNLAYELVLVGR